MSSPQSAEHLLGVPLPEAVGLPTGVRRERPEGPVQESLLDRCQVDYSCKKIARRCRRLRWRSEGNRLLKDVLSTDYSPVTLRCKGVPDAAVRVDRVRKGEWSIYFGREEGFGLDLIGSRRRKGEDPFIRITHLQAGMVEGDPHDFIDGHMTMIPEPGQEDMFRAYFGVPDDVEHPSHRFLFPEDRVFAAEAVREALGQVRRPR